MLLLIDHFDSFTYNIVHAIYEIEPKVLVVQSRDITLDEIITINPSHILLGPGPGSPKDNKVTLECLSYFFDKKPILGICLGHQCLGYFFGAKVERAITPVHGKVSKITHNKSALFNEIPQNFIVARYHSLIVKNLIGPLKATAWSENNEIMALEHTHLPLFGVQFHPESIASTYGIKLFENFLKI
jgi:anthranilate synthase/aminodeoxychorismate synthase-like glutamine amidotransferase